MAEVLCNDGTVDMNNGGTIPCIEHGGVGKQESSILKDEEAKPEMIAPNPKTMQNREVQCNNGNPTCSGDTSNYDCCREYGGIKEIDYRSDYWKNQPLSIKKLVFQNPKISYPIMIGLTGYGVYKLGKLPDTVNKERLKVVGAIVGGGGIAFLTAMGCAWGGCGDKSKVPIGLGVGFGVGGLTYLTSRTLFKQNPKNSLIASAILGGIGIAYVLTDGFTKIRANSNTNDKQNIGREEVQPVPQPIPPSSEVQSVVPLIIK
jgi:hypothetical protein